MVVAGAAMKLAAVKAVLVQGASAKLMAEVGAATSRDAINTALVRVASAQPTEAAGAATRWAARR